MRVQYKLIRSRILHPGPRGSSQGPRGLAGGLGVRHGVRVPLLGGPWSCYRGWGGFSACGSDSERVTTHVHGKDPHLVTEWVSGPRGRWRGSTGTHRRVLGHVCMESAAPMDLRWVGCGTQSAQKVLERMDTVRIYSTLQVGCRVHGVDGGGPRGLPGGPTVTKHCNACRKGLPWGWGWYTACKAGTVSVWMYVHGKDPQLTPVWLSGTRCRAMGHVARLTFSGTRPAARVVCRLKEWQ